jgi:large subunit ribosomal protein L9
MKASSVRKVAKEKGDAELLAKQFEGVSLNFTRKAGEHDALFGSVTSADIAHELEVRGFQIDRRKIELDQPLKALGEFNVPLKLHKEVTVQIKVAVIKQESEEHSA